MAVKPVHLGIKEINFILLITFFHVVHIWKYRFPSYVVAIWIFDVFLTSNRAALDISPDSLMFT